MEPSIRAAFSPINIIKTMNYFGERKEKKKRQDLHLGLREQLITFTAASI